MERWVWTPLEAGTGDTDLDTSHVEVIADPVGQMIFQSERVWEQRAEAQFKRKPS